MISLNQNVSIIFVNYIYIYVYLYIYIYILYILNYIYIYTLWEYYNIFAEKVIRENASSYFLKMHFWKYHRGCSNWPPSSGIWRLRRGRILRFLYSGILLIFLHVWIRERYVSGACLVVVVAKIRIFSTISYGNLSK